MLTIRGAQGRGHSSLAWLNSYYTFSFGGYDVPDHMGGTNLRVFNYDTVVAGEGFATHGHEDMEIISYALEACLVHKHSMGNGSVMRPGDVQRISGGTVVTRGGRP